MKKWYFASRFEHKDYINNLISLVKEKGHDVSYEWSVFGSLKPYISHKTECAKISSDIVDAIKDTDIFVLISDKGGTDMFIELGLMLAHTKPEKKIYIVGEYGTRSLMQLHPDITHVNTVEDIFSKEQI